MRAFVIALVALFGSLSLTPAHAQSRVETGVLTCDVSGGAGFVFGSSKSLACIFERSDGGVESYDGRINRWGLDIGATSRGTIVWAVFAPADARYAPGALQGAYAGVSGEATVGVGLGANALLGGSNRSFALQPLSVSGQEGMNFAVGIAELNLFAR